MDYKYKQALERAQKMQENSNGMILKKWLWCVFPELKENEDERIRKGLIKAVSGILKGNTLYGTDVTREEALTWLEKQGKQQGISALEAWKDMRLEVYQQASGNRHEPNYSDDSTKMFSLNDIDEIIEKISEQKLDDKVEPKFKVGNWYQCTKDFFGKGVTFDKNTAYYCAEEGCLQNEYGCHIAIVKDLYDNFKLWTIQDANAGDVLLEEETGEPFIYNGIRATSFSSYVLGAYCGVYNGEFNPYGNIRHWGKNSCPATKEQRDLLFRKMEEAGYEWDSEKKELKKIESKTLDADDILPYLGNNQVQDILEDMGMLDDNGHCPHTAEEIFKAGMEHAFNLNREAASSVKLDVKNR